MVISKSRARRTATTCWAKASTGWPASPTVGPLCLRYQAQAERHGAPSGPRAVEEFERLKALREELPNEAIFEAQPEQNETPCTPSETNPSPPENPAPAPGPPASAPELTLDLPGAPGILEDREVEARHPGGAPVPLPDTEAPLADR